MHATPAVLASETRARRAALRVLIVDDEEHVRDYLRSLVEELGATEIADAANGYEALRRIEREPPHLVFLDLNLPGFPGNEIMRQIGSDADAPIVYVVSSTNHLPVVQEMSQLGAAGYILKNLPRAALLALLGSALDEAAAAFE